MTGLSLERGLSALGSRNFRGGRLQTILLHVMMADVTTVTDQLGFEPSCTDNKRYSSCSWSHISRENTRLGRGINPIEQKLQPKTAQKPVDQAEIGNRIRAFTELQAGIDWLSLCISVLSRPDLRQHFADRLQAPSDLIVRLQAQAERSRGRKREALENEPWAHQRRMISVHL
ncbi:hypothetical protein ABIG06_006851 [Bradyrhizobium sp. USDA 326]|uniref:hypothetical protein n=1 Tax=Bradyrhizobium sp. USDA 326 TaxID=3377726 RepID=UPI003C76EB87